MHKQKTIIGDDENMQDEIFKESMKQQ